MLIDLYAEVIIDDQINNCKEGISIYALSLADFANRAVAKTDFYPKTAEALQDIIVVSNQRKHLVVRLVDFLAFHLCP